MLFSSLFKGEKQIAVGKGRKRKLTIKDVVNNLDRLELTTANCTLIRDATGNEKLDDYGQVDVFRVRDETVFMHENMIFITTPTGMKLGSGVGGDSSLAEIISEAPTAGLGEGFTDEEAEEDIEEEEESPEGFDGQSEDEEDVDPDTVRTSRQGDSRSKDAYSEGDGKRAGPQGAEAEEALGLGEVIRLRFFSQRIPYELDCQISERFNPTRFRSIELTPRFGVGYCVKPLTDVRKRDKRRYVRYTHKIGFGHLRIRSEIQFQVYASRTNLEIPEKGVLSQTITSEDIQITPYANKEVEEVRGTEKLEGIVEFFMACMVNNPTEKRICYVSKPFLDKLNRSSLEGLAHFNVVGAQQATILPKIFIKKQPKDTSVAERQLAAKSGGAMDSRRLRALEEIQDRYHILTREGKIWQQRRRKKSVVGDFDNDRVLVGFSSAHGLASGDVITMRQFLMPAEVTDIGVENMTLKPIPYEDARSRELDDREFIRQEDGFQVELLNFGVGGAQVQGAETQGESFLKYLVGDGYDEMSFTDKVEALQKNAVLLNLYPVLNFFRSDTKEFEPYLPFRIPVVCRVARFRTSRNKEDEELQITSLGLEYIYNPISDNFSRDTNDYDKWEQITPYTENSWFIECHKSLQLLFGHDRAKEESFRDDGKKQDVGKKEEEQKEEEKAK